VFIFEHLVHVDVGTVIFAIVSAFTFVFTLAYNKPLRSVNAGGTTGIARRTNDRKVAGSRERERERERNLFAK